MPTAADSDKLLAVILAGGRSSRFGRDKALEPVLGVASIERVRAACLGAGVPVVVDARPTEGPLGAIVGYDHDVIVLACDMPFMNADLITRLALATHGDARVPRVDGRAQPLAARYARSALSKLRAAWDRGQRSIVKALDELVVDWLDDVDPTVLADFDTPDDLAGLTPERPEP